MPVRWLLVLLSIDAFFIAVHVVVPYPQQRWSLEVDRGYPELYGYGKALLAVLSSYAPIERHDSSLTAASHWFSS